MSILIDSRSRVLVQGGTGRGGRRQIEFLAQAGAPAVAASTPGRGGDDVAGVPVFDTVRQAVEHTGANVSVMHVPSTGGAATAAVIEAVEAGIQTITVMAEGINVHEAARAIQIAREAGVTVVGPNCLGAMTPGECALGMIPLTLVDKGRVGVVSRSGTLCLETLKVLAYHGIGVSTAVSMGGDPIVGRTQREYLQMFAADEETDALILLGEPGGTMEVDAAEAMADAGLPVVTYLAGATAPEGRRMGHLGALTTGRPTTVGYKRAAMHEAGAVVVDALWDVAGAVEDVLA